MIEKKLEILAPAGSAECLKAAVINGADAVYLGLKDFSARAKAANFSFEELADALIYAHLFGVKIYVAINTLIKNSEMTAAVSIIERAAQMGVDAFIIQDLGLLNNIKDTINVPLHASTQMGIHNVYGAEFAKKCGFDRVILSRESTLEDIRAIKERVDIEIETFVQGALCVAFSGNCLFSSLVSGYSGNRGKCLQLCRKKYEIHINDSKESGYYLSAKDLCLLPDLKSLRDAGVDSFKIEGRMRRPEYVGESVAIYKKATERLLEKDCGFSPDDMMRLKKIYNRGDYCNGYIGNPTENVVYPQVQGHKGIKIGTVEKVADKKVTLRLQTKLHSGDGLKFIGKSGETGGCLVSNPTEIIPNGSVKREDEVYLTTDSKQIEQINSRERKLELSYKIILQKNRFLKAITDCCGISAVTVSNAKVQNAVSAPMDEKSVRKIFSKSSASYFKVGQVEIQSEENVFVTIGQLKELRRAAERDIAAAVTNHNYIFKERINYGDSPYPLSKEAIRQNFGFSMKTLLIFDSPQYLHKFDNGDFIDAFVFSPKDYSDTDTIQRVFSESDKPVFLYLPPIARAKDLPLLERIAKLPYIDNVIADNLYALELFKDKNILLGSGLNFINDFVELEKIASLERDEMSKKDFVTVFSQVPVMTFAHCPYRNLSGGCQKNCKGYNGTLTDERGNVFNLNHFKVGYCYAQLKNDIPLCLSEEVKKNHVKKIVFDFRGYSADAAEKILSEMKNEKVLGFKHMHFNNNKKLW